MDCQIAAIRRCSGGNLRIETPDGHYWLSPDEVRLILFFGDTVPLRQNGGIIDGEARAYPHKCHEGRWVVIQTAHYTFNLIDTAFKAVAKGEWVAAPLSTTQRVAP
jgi:hypothetical protein